MSPNQPQCDGAAIAFGDDNDVGAEEPQLPRAPSTHQEQPLPFYPMQPGLGWEVLSAGRAMTGTQVYGTPAYNTQGGAYMGQYPDIPTDTGPYAVQHAHTSPAVPYHGLQPQTAFEIDAGTDAGQQSHTQMHYSPQANSPTLQVQHNVVSPSQLDMSVPGFEPNNMGHLDVTGPSPPSGPSTSSQDPSEPNTNPNGWTPDQEDLVRHGKHEGKKVKQIGAELKRRFGVERSDNSISKRWKIIKKRYSKVGSKDVVQNVMSPSLQLLNTELARVVPGLASSAQNHHDPQVAGSMHAAQECFEKGYTKLVEDYMFMLQRGQAQTQAQAQAQGQVQGLGRHGGANL